MKYRSGHSWENSLKEELENQLTGSVGAGFLEGQANQKKEFNFDIIRKKFYIED